MRKVKNVKLDDYVLVTRWSDRTWGDPWFVGTICEHGEDIKGRFYCVSGSNRRWRNCWKLSPEEGSKILSLANEGIESRCPHMRIQ